MRVKVLKAYEGHGLTLYAGAEAIIPDAVLPLLPSGTVQTLEPARAGGRVANIARPACRMNRTNEETR